MSTRLNQPKTGAKVIVMQRLHERDLTGHLAERGGDVHLCLPAEYEPSHPFVWPKDSGASTTADRARAPCCGQTTSTSPPSVA